MRGRYEDRQRWKRLNSEAEVKAATSEREKGESHFLYWLPPPSPHQLSLFHPQPLLCPLPLHHDFLTYFSRKNRLGRKTAQKFKKRKTAELISFLCLSINSSLQDFKLCRG